MLLFCGSSENDTGLQTPDDVLRVIGEVESSNLPAVVKEVLLRNLQRFLAELKELQRKELEKKDTRAFEDSYLHYRSSSEKAPTVLRFGFDSGDVSRGKPCPNCGDAKLHQRQPLSYYVFDSAPSVEKYSVQCEVLGCTKCDTILHAQVPEFLAPEAIVGHFTARTVAAIALRRYIFGIPNMRQARISEIEGEPIPRTTQHDALAEGRERLRPLFEHLRQESADAVSRKIDDRAFPILDELADIQVEIENAALVGKGKDHVRHGIHSTVIISTNADGRQIVLMDTNRAHQGNVEWELNQKRTVSTPIITTSDLSSSAKSVEAFPEKNEDGYVPVSKKSKKPSSALEVRDDTCRGGCWAHLRMHIADAKDAIPEDQDRLLMLIAAVFEWDAATSDLTPEARLAFHQKNTKPIVDEFFAAIEIMRQDPRAEPNSSWGNALNYALENINHFRLFLKRASVALHGNQVEGTHTFQWRQENNSQHYKTLFGAQIGDLFQSLALTALANQENPLLWISACLEHCQEMAISPSSWMPWNFRSSLADLEKRSLNKKPYRIAKKRTKRVTRYMPAATEQSHPEAHILH
jgi:transposase